MIDWVSIVRNPGQKFSSYVTTIPQKVKRKRRKRRLKEQQELLLRQRRLHLQSEEGGTGSLVAGSSNGSGSTENRPKTRPRRLLNLSLHPHIDEDCAQGRNWKFCKKHSVSQSH